MFPRFFSFFFEQTTEKYPRAFLSISTTKTIKAGSTTEQQLIRKLMQFYEPSVRPVLNAQSVVNISFRMEITQLFELVREKPMEMIDFIRFSFQEEKTQILTTNVRIEQKWTDENLGWNQTEHDGIRGIRLPSHRIWLPDSYIYNAAFDLSSDTPTQGVVNGKKQNERTFQNSN